MPVYEINKPVLEEIVQKIWDELLIKINTSTHFPEPYSQEAMYQSDQIEQASSPALARAKAKDMLKMLLAHEDFENAITPYNQINVDDLKKILQFQILTAFNHEQIKKDFIFSWCHCIPVPKRISFAIRMINDIRTQFPDPNERIVFTAFASGTLLQEYVIIAPLVQQGYRKITLNIIDLNYPDPTMLRRILTATQTRTIKEAEQIGKEMLEESLFAQESSDCQENSEELAKTAFPEVYKMQDKSEILHQKAIDNFKKQLPTLKVNVFSTLDHYLSLVKNQHLESNVLTLIDPNLDVFKIASYPSESNLMGLTVINGPQKYVPHIFIALPDEQPIQIYVQDTAYKQSEEVRNLVEFIRAIARSTGADKTYNLKFRNTLIEAFSTYSPKALKKQLEQAKEILTQQIDYPSDNDKAQLAARSIKLIAKTSPDLEHARVKLTWYSDAHLAFQKLVETAKDNALIYLYYKYDPINDDTPPKFEQVTKQEYLNRDVFAPITGKLLTEDGIYFDETEFDETDSMQKPQTEEPHEEEWINQLVDEVIEETAYETNPDELYSRVDLSTGDLEIHNNP